MENFSNKKQIKITTAGKKKRVGAILKNNKYFVSWNFCITTKLCILYSLDGGLI